MIDAWSDPSNPPTPQQFPRSYGPNDGITKLLDKIKGIETNLREVTSNLLRTAGIYLSPAGMTIDSNLAITGTLSLPAGIIDNAALTSPVVPAIVNVSSGVTFTSAGTYPNVLSTTVTVPSGVTQLLVDAHSGTWCQGNSNTTGGSNGAGGDVIYSRTVIGGVTGQGFAVGISGSGGFGSVYSSLSVLLPGLTPGGTITLQSQTMSGWQNIPANAGNKLTLNAMLIWLH